MEAAQLVEGPQTCGHRVEDVEARQVQVCERGAAANARAQSFAQFLRRVPVEGARVRHVQVLEIGNARENVLPRG
eukprot:3467063-Rhodomonas_salina.3